MLDVMDGGVGGSIHYMILVLKLYIASFKHTNVNAFSWNHVDIGDE
jgi:hypothetical protein